MPIYEYRCETCGHVFEDMVLSGHSEPDTCPQCGANQVNRLISNTSFQLKGSGWYVTDYASSSGSGASSEGASDAKESDSSSASEASGSSGTAGDSSTSDTDVA